MFVLQKPVSYEGISIYQVIHQEHLKNQEVKPDKKPTLVKNPRLQQLPATV